MERSASVVTISDIAQELGVSKSTARGGLAQKPGGV